MIRNINDRFGDAVEFYSVDEMKTAIENSGYELPEDGLKEGRDYETIDYYRFESGSVYEYDADQNAYIFIGKLNGKTRKQFIKEYELEKALNN